MDALLRARAAGQSGLLSRAQALAGGLSPKAVQWRLGRGQWQVVHPGVYQTMPGRDGWETRAVAALLHAGDGSALCHSSAAYAWGLLRQAPDPIRVVVPAERRVRPATGVVVTRSRHASERIDAAAWPHRLTVEHTVLDLGTAAGTDRTMSLAAKAVELGLTTPEQLRGTVLLRPRQRDRSLLLEVLTDVADGCESPAERRYVRDVERAHGLPRGRRQTPYGRAGRRDVEYQWGVVVEVDGRLATRRGPTSSVTAAVTGAPWVPGG
ncbi:type IV toxin-antitoxin system AbiEi family antitoxin domain-containing protein [Terrabacter carboxydivorans]|uniref:AbiEi antitoxin N-terminal domain-containing protein n=1 Tax=Terrabacter carboxydivorans TaxID=619730 RepID=A0ABN3M0Q9_9MICO